MSAPASAAARALAIPELVLKVLPHLCQPDLVRTALVNRELGRLSQLIMYEHVELRQYSKECGYEIRSDDYPKKVMRLTSTLLARPDLAREVREISLLTRYFGSNSWGDGILQQASTKPVFFFRST